uniref:Uncharacterized protein n=1 Tax=Nothobranchius kuhntae TaxID=321403 RepID=A0A1A8JZT9_NOTKU
MRTFGSPQERLCLAARNVPAAAAELRYLCTKITGSKSQRLLLFLYSYIAAETNVRLSLLTLETEAEGGLLSDGKINISIVYKNNYLEKAHLRRQRTFSHTSRNLDVLKEPQQKQHQAGPASAPAGVWMNNTSAHWEIAAGKSATPEPRLQLLLQLGLNKNMEEHKYAPTNKQTNK